MKTFSSLILVVALCLGSMSACANNPPPTLSPAASLAFQNTQVIKALDQLRDIAIAANAQTPPLVSTEDTRKVVTYHESALRIIDANRSGWKSAVQTGLDELVKGLPPPTATRLTPYTDLIKTVLQEVVQ
jgi:hypothetical protein